jgi:F-type H+-transporting ATPase subunit a
MKDLSPLEPDILFHVGFLPVSRAVLTTWVIIIVLAVVCRLALKSPKEDPGPVQASLEIVVSAIRQQLGDILDRDPDAYLPLLGTLFIFILLCNLSSILPGVYSPTARLETAAALATVVFFSVHYFGIRLRGIRIYLGRYLKPNPLLLPLNIVEEITRTFSLMVRLFGNIMSHEMVIAIVLVLAGLFVPIPFMVLGILIGIIQAYIFTVLAAVFVASALRDESIGRKTT